MTEALHTIAFTHEHETVIASITCHAKPDESGCRVGPCSKGCDELTAEHDDVGWFHTYDGDVRHDLDPYDGLGCNYKSWIDNDDEGVVGCFGGDDGTPVYDGPIKFVWDDGYYTWHYAEDAA